MEKSSFLSEWKQVVANRKVLVPIIAVIFVPLLYSGMFLWSFWDPYDHLQDLPVAIVNQDTGVNFEGEQLELGHALIEKLKDNEVFQFHFVSEEKGYRGLENRKYYMLVEIPKDFSRNATTLMDEQPKKLALKYMPNESYNFLSSQIGETAMKEIKAGIATEVSATYAETMFDKVMQVGDGLELASQGSEELNNGADKLVDGSHELKDSLEILASSSVEFENGVTKVRSGSNELKVGTQELASGISQLTDAGDQLYSASKDVDAGAQLLGGGISQVRGGLEEITEKIPELIAGTEQVHDGLEELQAQLPLQISQTIDDQIQASGNKMSEGLDQLNQGIDSQLRNELASGLSSQVSSGVAKAVAAQIVDTQTQQIQQLSTVLMESGMPEETVNGIVDQIVKDSPTIEEIEQGLQAQLQPKIKAGIDEGIDQAVVGIDGGFEQYKDEVDKKLSTATTGIDKEIQTAVDPVFNQITSGLDTINAGQFALADGVNQLFAGAKALEDGSVELNSGQQEYVKNLELFTQKLHEADLGSNQLANGVNNLNEGMGQLADGSSKISEGSEKIAEGSGKLTNGTIALHEGTTELHEKLSDAANEVNAVTANEDTYEMMGNPVEVNKQEVNPVPNYGTGFAPYFISLGLFVGALLMTIVFNLKKPAIEPRTGFNWFAGKFGVVAIIGIIQALLVDTILLWGLGINVRNVPLFIFVSIMTSLVFITLIQLLVTTLGDPGRFIAIIILILQLTTSAGTFPLELIPNVLRPFNNLLPMTYTVQAFKAVISSGDYSFMWQNIGILGVYMMINMILTTTYFIFKKKRNEPVKVA